MPKWLLKPHARWYRKTQFTETLPCDSNMSWPGSETASEHKSPCVSLFAWSFDLPQQISTILSNSWPTLVQRWPSNVFVYGPACYWRGFTKRCLSTWSLTFWPHSSMPLSLVSLRWLSRCVEGHVRDLSLSPLLIKTLMDPLYCLKILDSLVCHHCEDKRLPGRFRTGSSGVVSYLWPLL